MINKNIIKTNQFFIVFFLSLAFILNLPVMVLAVGFIMFIGSYTPKAALFFQIYQHGLKNWIKPNWVEERSDPHQFSQRFGGVVVLFAFVFTAFFNMPNAGWGLSLLVILLALVNLVFDFCAGCFLYFQLEKLNVFGKYKKEVNENV